jgi:hypothetical protein
MAGPQLSGDTETSGQGAVMMDAPGPDDVDRPMPCDPPGARDAAGWMKTDAGNADGWSRIDDVGDDGAPAWRQC